MVKIGGWSDDEQGRIFELMKEHFTSWSSISKSLNGRTENSIKNYFYSTVRRIQSCKVIDYFDAMKQQKDLPPIESADKFHTLYQLDSLNNLGVIMCKWLFAYDKSKDEHKSLFDYLLNVIADEKKRPKPKNSKLDIPFEKSQIENSNQDPDQGYIKNLLPELFSGKTYQGVHPLLPLALYGGFGRLKSRDFFKNVSQEPQASSFPQIFNAPRPEPPKVNLENTSDISIPIPQVKYTLKENADDQLLGDLPNRLSEVLRNDRLQHSLFNLLISNLSKSMQAPPAPHLKPIPAGNWNSSSDQHKAGGVVIPEKGTSPPFRATQQPRNTGFAPVNLSNDENRPKGSFSERIKDIQEKEILEKVATKESQGLAESRRSPDSMQMCSRCLLTTQVCRCLL